MWMFIATGLLLADLTGFAMRVADALEQAGARSVVLRAENQQVAAAMEEAFRGRRLVLVKETHDSGYQVQAC